MRNISFSLTTPQFIAGIKDVTRRVGWLFLKAGDELCAIEKGQGLGKDEQVKRLGKIHVVDVRYEPLRKMTDDTIYGLIECNREGFSGWEPEQFVAMFCQAHHGCTPESVVTRIEFVKLNGRI